MWNNPLNRTDPSGFCWICDPIGETTKTINHIGDVIATDAAARTLMTVAIAYYTGQWVGGPISGGGLGMGAIWGGAAGGAAASAFASNGDINAIAIGAVTGAGFGWAGGIGGDADFTRYAAHASVGCVSAVAGGGSCGAGAASAVFGKYTTNSISGWGGSGIGGVIARGVATTVAGGVGSVTAGGKFENGATTAAYGYLFNQMQSVLRHAFSSNQRYPNGDIGYAVVDKTRSALIAGGEVATDAIAACGVVAAPCRTADAVLSWEKAGIELITAGDGRAAVGAMSGQAAGSIQESILNTANTHSIPGNGLSKVIIESMAYVTGKLVEWQVMQQLKPFQ